MSNPAENRNIRGNTIKPAVVESDSVSTDEGTITSLDGTSLQYESVLNQIGDAKIQSAWDGLVVPVADGVGMADAINPATTATPVQDAIDVLTAQNLTGEILLPPTTVNEDNAIEMAQGISIRGWGFGTLPGGDLSRIKISTSGSKALDFAAAANGGDLTLDGFVIVGRGMTDTPADAIHFRGDNSFRNINIGRIGFHNWRGSIIHGDTGSYIYASTLGEFIYANDVDAGGQTALINLESRGPQSRMGLLHLYPKPDGTAENTDILQCRNMSLRVEHMNIGGSAGRVIRNSPNDGPFPFEIGMVNYESTAQQSTPYSLFQIYNNVRIWSVRLNNGGGDPATDYVYNLITDNGRNIMGPLQVDTGFTINNTKVRIANEPADTSYYFGESADITNSAGSSTGLVRSLASAGTGNG